MIVKMYFKTSQGSLEASLFFAFNLIKEQRDFIFQASSLTLDLSGGKCMWSRNNLILSRRNEEFPGREWTFITGFVSTLARRTYAILQVFFNSCSPCSQKGGDKIPTKKENMIDPLILISQNKLLCLGVLEGKQFAVVPFHNLFEHRRKNKFVSNSILYAILD